MGFTDWIKKLFTSDDERIITNKRGYQSFDPEKQIWYRYYSVLYSIKETDIPNLPDFSDVERFDLKPYAYLNNKRYQARFFVTDKFCIITTKEKKLAVPLERCSFMYRIEHYVHKDEPYYKYYVTVLIKGNLSKEDFLRYNKLKKKKIVEYDEYGKPYKIEEWEIEE